MTLKIFKPYTKSRRGTVLVDKKSLWKGKPIKSLTFGKVSTGGRNNLGRLTSRSKGAGHKNKYRYVDFYRKNKFALQGDIEYNRRGISWGESSLTNITGETIGEYEIFNYASYLTLAPSLKFMLIKKLLRVVLFYIFHIEQQLVRLLLIP